MEIKHNEIAPLSYYFWYFQTVARTSEKIMGHWGFFCFIAFCHTMILIILIINKQHESRPVYKTLFCIKTFDTSVNVYLHFAFI